MNNERRNALCTKEQEAKGPTDVMEYWEAWFEHDPRGLEKRGRNSSRLL